MFLNYFCRTRCVQASVVMLLLVFFSGCKRGGGGSLAVLKKSLAGKSSLKEKEDQKEVWQPNSSEMNFDDMLAQAEFDFGRGHYLSAAEWYQKLIRKYPESERLADFKFREAECYFLGRKYKLASDTYKDFVSLFPSDLRVNKARFMALESYYNHAISVPVDCDSSDTRVVIDMCKDLLADETMAEMHKDVAVIMKHCRDRLLNKDVAVFDSYVRRGKFQSAKNRLEKIKSEYLSKDEGLKPRVIFLECKLAKSSADENRAQRCLDILTEKYPDSKYAKMAMGYMNAGSLANVIFG